MNLDWTAVAIAVIGLVFSGVLIPLVKAGFTWLATKTENEALKAALDEAQQVATDTVAMLQQTMVEGLKAQAADGRLTAEEARQVAEDAVNVFMTDISSKSAALLAKRIPDWEGYAARLIEAKLFKMKQDTPLALSECLEIKQTG